MRTKVTLVLLFLNVVLFFFIFRFERRWRTEESWKEARRRVLGTEAADIRTLEITGAGRTVALKKTGDTWLLTSPIEWPANLEAVRLIVSDLQLLEHETSFSVADLAKNGQSLADYGLDRPKLTVTFTSGDPTADLRSVNAGPLPVTTLRLGDTTKDNLRLYLLSPDGTRIHVVNQNLARSLGLTFEELHADSVFTIPVFEARSLNLQTAAPASLRIRLRRDGSRWSFETPIIARASKNRTELAINALNSLRVQAFVTTNPPALLPADRPSLRISLEGNNRRETLLLGDPLGTTALPAANATAPDLEYYAQLDGRAALFTVAVPAALKRELDQAQETLREPRILDFDSSAVTTVALTAPGQPPVTLQRLDTGAEAAAWQIVRRADGAAGPQTVPADGAAVTRLLEQLTLLAATKFQSDAPRDADREAWGFNRPERTVTLTLAAPVTATTGPVAAQQTSLTLELALPSPRAPVAYARLVGPAASASIYALDAEVLREVPATPLAWRERHLRELPTGARLSGLKLTDLSNQHVLLETTLDPQGHPSGPLAHPAAVAALLPPLRSLRAKEFILDHFVDSIEVGGEVRPWRFRLDTTVTLTGGADEQTSTTSLFLSPRVGGDRQWAGSPDINAVFAIEQPLLDALFVLTEAPRDPGPAAEPAK